MKKGVANRNCARTALAVGLCCEFLGNLYFSLMSLSVCILKWSKQLFKMPEISSKDLNLLNSQLNEGDALINYLREEVSITL